MSDDVPPSAALPSEVLRYVTEVASVLSGARRDLVGVYVHGSAVLGGFRSERSDVDVLAVVAGPSGEAEQRALGVALADTAVRCPGTGLELSVVTSATAADLGPCAFEVHVRASARERVVVPGAGHAGDHDLVLHCAVCREHAHAVCGPPASEVFGRVSAERVVAAMMSELRWGLDQADPTYAVLNACRALRFAEGGGLCSKVDGGRWYLSRHGGHAAVAAAVAHQLGEGAAPSMPAAIAFVEAARPLLTGAGH
ncbi:aminoglycoside adenylyltransferase domain-containing protein [Streptomyces sp. NPDC050145]|uniref:aminoglycoside adenylyltransferase domain-containing protein n=1 Tax=Streptomyces sp. NPDC050145 TaxID=3365602 RepID=UPI0037B5C621